MFNYQVSHIYGKTKNIFLFEAPWNIALVPKIIDPFTGHETKGLWSEEYQQKFIAYANEKYVKFVSEYNELITNATITTGILEYISDLKKREGATKQILQFEKDVLSELTTIDDVAKRENNKETIVQVNTKLFQMPKPL